MSVRRSFVVGALALLFALAPLGASTPMVFAQPTAGEAPKRDLIARGQHLFEEQQYEESIQTLSAALLRPSNTKEQKVLIYRLLALNYITLNRRDEAESAVRGLLALAPEYTLPAAESPRFRNFFAEVQKKWEAEGRPGVVTDSKPAAPAVLLRHQGPSESKPDQNIALRLRVEDPGLRAAGFKLFVRAGSRGKFTEQPLSHASEDGTLLATIPAAFVRPPLVEYYVQAVDDGGLPIAARGDADDPLRVAIPEPNKGWVLPLAIGGGVLGAAAIVGALALAGVFSGSTTAPPDANRGTVRIIVGGP
jgi:hypothetical protein